MFACDEALRIIDEYEPPTAPRVEVPQRAGVARHAPRRRAASCTTATRSTRQGLILTAKIVPPTSQNQKRIEDDLREFVPQLVA